MNCSSPIARYGYNRATKTLRKGFPLADLLVPADNFCREFFPPRCFLGDYNLLQVWRPSAVLGQSPPWVGCGQLDQ